MAGRNRGLPAYDVVVVGAGYIGCAAAHYCVARGPRTALVDRGRIPGGASLANFGNVQVQDAELQRSLPMVTAGYRRMLSIEEELGCPVGFEPRGSLLLIENATQWALMEQRLPQLNLGGVAAEIVPGRRLAEVEPLLDAGRLFGACYNSHEGRVSPFAFLGAFLRRAREGGLVTLPGTEVTGFRQSGSRITGITTREGDISAGVVVLTTGAWTAPLGRLLGREWAIPFIHGQALVTEASPQRLRNHLASAAFFEEMAAAPGDNGAAAVAVFAVAQTSEGHFLLGEACAGASRPTMASTPAGQAAIAREVLRFLPVLARLPVLRGWGVPVAYTGDGLPYLGKLDGLDGLIVATAFKSTVVVTPLVGDAVAELIDTGWSSFDISWFAPDRRVNGLGQPSHA